MLARALFDPLGVVVLLAIVAMSIGAALWYRLGQRAADQLEGGLSVLRRVAGELGLDHPIRRRLESAAVVDLSFEEITRLMAGDARESAARAILDLQGRVAWIERFAQFAVHLGILGTVFALVSSDPTDLDSFRSRLPMALGTTFWGLIGALALSAIAGACEGVIDSARQQVRLALLDGLDASPGKASPADVSGEG